jgi:hypothetical protein
MGFAMPRTPIIAFSGNFFFQMPEYNNDPKGQQVGFDPGKDLNAVKAFAGSDPADYFRFKFDDCKVTSIAWSDGKQSALDDELIGRPVNLTGFMVDVSPSAICAVIYAGRIDLGGAASGAMAAAFQSDLRLNVRPQGFGDVTAAAHYVADITLKKQGMTNSPALDSLCAESRLEIVLQLNRYTDAVDSSGQVQPRGLIGDVYGFIRRKGPNKTANGARLKNRRFVAHPEIGKCPAIEEAFLTSTGGTPLIRITDIDGYYDIDRDAKSLVVRPLDFIPFLDFNYSTPTSAGVVKQYMVYAVIDGSKTDIKSFFGTHEEMLATGGAIVVDLSERQGDLATLSLGVDVITLSDERYPLMIETEWDLELNSPRGLKLASRAVQRIGVTVYRNNLPVGGIQSSSRSRNDGRSPTVADIQPVNGGISAADGLVEFDITAKDLMNLGNAADPVTGQVINRVPLDRQYGNAVYVAIPNPLRRTAAKTEEVEICVRVLLVFDVASIAGRCSFQRDVEPMFGYYIRFFPWLHSRHSGTGYRRFFNLEDLQSVGAHIDEMIRRLRLPDDHEDKMPRSRDLPVGVVEVLNKWRADGWQP